MKSLPHVLLAATVLAAAPAAAQDKAPAAAAAQPKVALKLSKDVQNAASQAQQLLIAKNAAGADPLIAQAEAAAKTDDDRYIVAALRLNSEALKMDGGGSSQALKAPLDALIANPKTPRDDVARYTYQRGVIAQEAKNGAEAATYFAKARELGYSNPQLDLQLVKTKFDAGDTAGGLQELDQLIAKQTAAGQKPDEQLFRYAISKTSAAKQGPQTFAWIEKYLTAYPTTKNWRDMTVFYGIQPQAIVTLDKGQKIDLYRLLRTGKALADQYDYEIYGQYTFDVGVPYETKLVLNEGKASGKIPAGSANATSLLAAANKSISNDGPLSGLATRANAAPNGKLAANTADAFLGNADYAKAVDLYKVALQKGGVDAAAVNTRLGIALANQGDKQGARTAFQAVNAGPRADVAKLWILFLDHPPVA